MNAKPPINSGERLIALVGRYERHVVTGVDYARSMYSHAEAAGFPLRMLERIEPVGLVREFTVERIDGSLEPWNW